MHILGLSSTKPGALEVKERGQPALCTPAAHLEPSLFLGPDPHCFLRVGTKAIVGDTVCECHHLYQQGLEKSIIGLAMRKAVPGMALGTSLSPQGDVTSLRGASTCSL